MREEIIYKKLSKIIDLNTLQNAEEYEFNTHIKSGSFMDLVIEKRNNNDKRHSFVISLAHYYTLNGDLMSDPYMEIEVYPNVQMAEALTFENSSMGIYQNVYVYNDDGSKKGVYKRLKSELNTFLNQWLTNLIKQGFKYGNA